MEANAQNFTPRGYQYSVLRSIASSEYDRGVCVWHRRAGKDKDGFNLMVYAANPASKNPGPIQRVGNYIYVFPTYAQGKEALWENIDGDGFRTIDHAPAALVASKNVTDMRITFTNSSTIRIMGAEFPNRLRGPNPVGVIFSEYAVMNPRAWDVVRPILLENGGWALFLYTPLGKNHGKTLWDMASKNPAWFSECLTVEDTFRPDGRRVITEAMIEAERASGMAEEMIEQEYYCSWSGAMVGSYYGKLLEAAEKEGRISKVPYDPALPVHTMWDLGIGDAMAIWFAQQVGREIRLIDYYVNSGEGMAHYAKVLGEKPYVYGTHYAPHDAKARMLDEKGRTRVEVAKNLGIDFNVMRQLAIDDGIEAVRNMLPRTWIDSEKCERGVDALKSYRKEYDEKRQQYHDRPYHDWSSHGADALRTGAVGLPGTPKGESDKPGQGGRRGYSGEHGWMA